MAPTLGHPTHSLRFEFQASSPTIKEASLGHSAQPNFRLLSPSSRTTTASSTAMIGVAGVLLIAMIGMVQGSGSCSAAAYKDIGDGVANNDIVFNGGSSLTRSHVCTVITNRHNSKNSAFLGGLVISISECTNALSSPPPYTPGQQNKWAGKHCRTEIVGGVATPDDADWEDISAQSSSPYTQDVTFLSTPPPPSGFNEVTGGNIVKGDGADSFQGCYVGYVIALSGGPECMVKVTETDAFIECLKTFNSVKRRTSAGYFNNYAHYTVKSPGSTCT